MGRAAKDHMVDVDLTLEVPTVCSDKGLVEQEVGVRFFFNMGRYPVLFQLLF